MVLGVAWMATFLKITIDLYKYQRVEEYCASFYTEHQLVPSLINVILSPVVKETVLFRLVVNIWPNPVASTVIVPVPLFFITNLKLG